MTGLYCSGDGCNPKPFYKNQVCDIASYEFQGNVGEVYGKCDNLPGYISIKENGAEFLNISNQEKEQIQTLIDSLNIENQKTTKTFTHQNYPGLEIKYPSDWSLSKDDRGDQGMTLTFSKDGLELEYGIGTAAVFGFGPYVPACTNNTNLYLSPDNSEFYRIRTNQGERFYVKNYERNVNLEDQQHFEFLRQGNYAESKSKWVYGVPGKFEICLTVQGQTHVIDTTYPIPEGIATSQTNLAGMTTIKLKNVDLSKQSLLAEADQIVASTKF